MKEQEVIDYLKGYKAINFCIDAKTLELERIRKQKYDLCAPRAVSFESVSGKSGKISDPTFNIVWQLNEQFDRDMERLVADIERLKYQKMFIDNMLNTLLPHEQKLLRLRYFEGKKWCVIENMMNYSQRQPFNIHKKIIKKLADQLSA